ncbi:MAG TPA: DUF5658 family protein [Planctomycetaceae bacterium]|nr:DUF5658 family protein [Planctomycetaceae bacterium]
MANSSFDPDDEPEHRPSWRRLFKGHLPLEKETTAFILVSVLDIFMTYVMLRSGPLPGGGIIVESNPVAAYFIHHWGSRGMIYFKMAMTAFVCVISQIVALKKPGHAEFILKIGILIVGGVVIYSLVMFIRTM